MKKNVVFRYGYRVENRIPVKTRQFRTHIKIGLLAGFVFVVGWMIMYRDNGSVEQVQQALGQNSFESIDTSVSVEDPKKSYSLVGIDFPTEGQAAIGTLSDGILQADPENEQLRPIASMTKVITALAILEKAPIKQGDKGSTITLNAKDEQYYWDYVAKGGTVTSVTAGLEMTQYEALQAILLPSSNNMADSLVDRYFSSKEEYLDYANQLISKYGLQSTKVADASGFSPDSVSSPSEMIIIGQKALQNPIIAEIVAQPQATIPVAGDILNYNALIMKEGVTGIKPGLTDEAGLCLLFSSKVKDINGNDVTIIGVVMGINDYLTYLDGAKTMLDQATQQIQKQSL